MATKASGTLHLKLRADSGYSSDESHRITPEQWGDVLRVVTGKLSSDVLQEALKAMAAFFGPEGAPPSNTGEFRDLKIAHDKLSALLEQTK